MDEGAFVDWDECHGPMDTIENRKAFPENFFYECCNQDATFRGCVSERHLERPKSVKKARYC